MYGKSTTLKGVFDGVQKRVTEEHIKAKTVELTSTKQDSRISYERDIFASVLDINQEFLEEHARMVMWMAMQEVRTMAMYQLSPAEYGYGMTLGEVDRMGSRKWQGVNVAGIEPLKDDDINEELQGIFKEVSSQVARNIKKAGSMGARQKETAEKQEPKETFGEETAEEVMESRAFANHIFSSDKGSGVTKASLDMLIASMGGLFRGVVDIFQVYRDMAPYSPHFFKSAPKDVLPDDQFLTTYLQFFPEQVHAVRPLLSAAVLSRRFAAIDNHILEMKRKAVDLDQEGFEEFRKDYDRQASKRKRVKTKPVRKTSGNNLSDDEGSGDEGCIREGSSGQGFDNRKSASEDSVGEGPVRGGASGTCVDMPFLESSSEDSSDEDSDDDCYEMSPAKGCRDMMVQDPEEGKKERGRRKNRRHKSKLEDPNRTRAQRNYYSRLQTLNDKDPSKKRKRSHTCSHCKTPGHNIKKCPKLAAQRAKEIVK
ncbi:hypothetical protein BGX24_002255, partial [Mortierella sp. AD032]